MAQKLGRPVKGKGEKFSRKKEKDRERERASESEKESNLESSRDVGPIL